MDLHEIARQAATTAGADFAFVLSRAGLLVTRDAPKDMPERGRMKIAAACPKGTNGEVAHIEMPRQDLVPFGGAAPVDVFAMRVEDAAILVLVLPSWNDKRKVGSALAAASVSLTEMIHKAKKVRAQKAAGQRPAQVGKKLAEPRKERASAVPAEPRKERASAVPAEGKRERAAVTFEPARRERTSAAPHEPKRERPLAVPPEPKRSSAAPPEPKRSSAVPAAVARRERATLTFEPVVRRASAPPRAPREAAAAKKPLRPRVSSEPEIVVGEAAVGRETLAAIEPFLPRRSSEPEIVVGEAAVGRETLAAIEPFLPRRSSEPEIVIGEAPVGRDTLVAIEAALPKPTPGPAPEAFRVELDSISRESMLEVERMEAAQRGRPTVEEPLVTERRTLPWVDTPAALKRTMEARELARAAAPPEVKLGVEELDADLLEQALREGK